MGSSIVGGFAESVWGAFDPLTVEVDTGGAAWTSSMSPDLNADGILGAGGDGADDASSMAVKAPVAGGDKSNGAKSPWHSSSNLFSRSIGGAFE
jgi:hypothetical protein